MPLAVYDVSEHEVGLYLYRNQGDDRQLTAKELSVLADIGAKRSWHAGTEWWNVGYVSDADLARVLSHFRDADIPFCETCGMGDWPAAAEFNRLKEIGLLQGDYRPLRSKMSLDAHGHLQQRFEG